MSWSWHTRIASYCDLAQPLLPFHKLWALGEKSYERSLTQVMFLLHWCFLAFWVFCLYLWTSCFDYTLFLCEFWVSVWTWAPHFTSQVQPFHLWMWLPQLHRFWTPHSCWLQGFLAIASSLNSTNSQSLIIWIELLIWIISVDNWCFSFFSLPNLNSV